MSEISKRAITRRAVLRDSLAAAYPTLLAPKPVPVLTDRSAITLGRDRAAAPLMLPQRARGEHMHVIGTTGGGKSKFIEHCVRQDVVNESGVLVLDPHGQHKDSLYRSLIVWLDQRGYSKRRTIHLFDPNAPTHTIGFNPLAKPDPETDVSVIAGIMLEAFAQAWEGEQTSTKPTIERVLTTIFAALTEFGLSLAEAPFLLDRRDRHGLRAFAIDSVNDRYTRDELLRLHELSLDDRRTHDYDIETIGPVNRLARFLRPTAIRAMVGQTDRVFDFRQAMDEGHIVLANLSGGHRVYERDADLLGRLLMRSLFVHAKRRRHPERPFFVFADECHRFLSGDVEGILAESRKYGINVVLANQWQRQFGSDDENMLAAVRNATNVKVVFRIKDPVEAEELAHAVVPLDLEMPVRALTKPAVVGHRLVKLNSESAGVNESSTDSYSETAGESVTETDSYSESVGESFTYGTSVSASDSVSVGASTSSAQNWSRGFGETLSRGENRSTSRGDSTSRSSSSGRAENRSAGETRLPLKGDLFETPTVLSVNEGGGATTSRSLSDGTTSSRSNATGTSASRSMSRSAAAGGSIGKTSSVSRSSGTSIGESYTEGATYSSTEGYAISRGSSRATTVGTAESRGTSRSAGTQEAFEPLYANLPSAVHSKENVLYMAAQTLRNLVTGQAFVNFVGAHGMVSTLLTVPRISEHPISESAFAALRERILSESSAATPINEALRLVAEREQKLVDARRALESEPEPVTFRTKAPSGAVVGQGRSRPAASNRGQAGPSAKERRAGR